jgi:two-component system sensor histidine kinase DesK
LAYAAGSRIRNNGGMNSRNDFYQMLGGVGTALVVTVISGMVMWQKPAFAEVIVWQLLIAIAIFMVTNDRIDENRVGIRRAALWIMLLLIFSLSWRVPTDIFFIYTIIWVACTPFYLSAKSCWAWLLLINVAWYFVRSVVWQDANPLIQTLLVGTFHVFALLSATTAKESQQANEKTQQLNRELLATQHLLGEASRESERTRIARDLHDLLGHHLTALTINLQVAGRLISGESGEAKEKVDQCHALSKLLLNDVREAVSELHDMPSLDLRELLEITVRDIPRLNISLKIEDQLQLDDVNTAEVFIRLVQEAITNTLKHSGAHNATIQVYTQGEQILLNYSDDGNGCDDLKVGNGLIGMRERVERLGGKLHIESKPNFNLQVTTPS